jgi:hypothetical protein
MDLGALERLGNEIAELSAHLDAACACSTSSATSTPSVAGTTASARAPSGCPGAPASTWAPPARRCVSPARWRTCPVRGWRSLDRKAEIHDAAAQHKHRALHVYQGDDGMGELNLIAIEVSVDYRVGARDGAPFLWVSVTSPLENLSGAGKPLRQGPAKEFANLKQSGRKRLAHLRRRAAPRRSHSGLQGSPEEASRSLTMEFRIADCVSERGRHGDAARPTGT